MTASQAAERVEDTDLQLASRAVGEIVPRAIDDETHEPLDNGHG